MRRHAAHECFACGVVTLFNTPPPNARNIFRYLAFSNPQQRQGLAQNSSIDKIIGYGTRTTERRQSDIHIVGASVVGAIVVK